MRDDDDDDDAFLIYYSTHIQRADVLWSIFICGSFLHFFFVALKHSFYGYRPRIGKAGDGDENFIISLAPFYGHVSMMGLCLH